MASSLEDRLYRLRQRRLDPSHPEVAINKSFGLVEEAYEKRAQDKATVYALGAMQEVDPRSTEISNEESDKVKAALERGLEKLNLYPQFRRQGSVPLNLHIRGASDVDLLVLEGRYLVYERCSDSQTTYAPYAGRGTLAQDVLYLRQNIIRVLQSRYSAAKINTFPEKNIELTGGAFRRKVDVVPAHWLDTADYQKQLEEIYRGVTLINRTTHESVQNFPFLFRAHIELKDRNTDGGIKMAIRLAKNLKNDCDSKIELSSYDIASLAYHCPNNYVRYAPSYDLRVLSGISRWFEELVDNSGRTLQLETPDKTRKIIDVKQKWRGLELLTEELSELAQQVANEKYPNLYNRSEIRAHLNDSYIPIF